MAKTCIRVEACNIGSSERHNLRSKELDYIRPELTHRNEQWVECSIAEVHRDITEKYKEATGQGLQKKATPIREGVIVISEESYPNPGRGNSNQRGNHNPAASRLGRKTGRTLWSARLPNLHP